jgi:predicted PurR-regulated permease PerM
LLLYFTNPLEGDYPILLIGFYWTIEGETGLRILFRPFSFDRRDRAYEMLLQIELRVGGYLRGQLILAVTIGLADFTVYSIIGLPAALAVSLLAGLFEMIPMIGTTLGMIPALLVAFAYDPAKAVLVLVAGITVQAIENNLLSPRVMHKTVGINPIVTVLAIVAFGALFGFAGYLLNNLG